MHVMTARLQRLLHQIRHALQSPSRTTRMAVVIGRLLATGFLVCFATGVFSHFFQDPAPWMLFATRPVWFYAVTQGVHVTAGIACIPLLLAKLYIVYPDLFQTPPVRSAAHVAERASIAVFVSASLVQLAIGLLNTYQMYSLFGFSFRHVHYALSYVILGSLAIHIGVKLPSIVRYWRRRDSVTDTGAIVAAEPDAGPQTPDELQRLTGRGPQSGITGRLFAWIDEAPAPRDPDHRARQSRRAFLAAVTTAVASVTVLTAGQSFRVLDAVNVFAPRKNDIGPQRLPVNKTAKAAGVTAAATGPDWELVVSNGSQTQRFDRERLAGLAQHDAVLPIACVEGWSQNARWRGPRLRDVMDVVGAPADASVRVTSLQTRGPFGVTLMQPEFVRDPLTLVALQLEGEDLDIDHGYPARIIAPARPGVLQTKWLSRIEVIA